MPASCAKEKVGHEALVRGLVRGLEATGALARAMVPAYVLVRLLDAAGIVGWLVGRVEPAMAWFGLPGKAAIPLVVGNVVSLYSGIGALASLDLPVEQASIVALMLCLSHNLVVESAILRRMGMSFAFVTALRLVAALGAGWLARLWWTG